MKACAVAALTAIFAAPAHAAEVRRIAILVANNTGGEGTSALRYAKSDAEKVGAVLVELGGYREGDVHYLFDADVDRARTELAEVEATVARAKKDGAETTLLVYYSGHARDGALRLGTSRWPMSELRGLLTRSVADVRIGIIDACQSGAITRTKGGRPGPSFMFAADDGQPAHGLVLITSSSDDEDSQESDQLGGSYFTHYLASGLRGDADDSGDHQVTLAEVYGYAYSKTITQTVETRAGTQHPTYSYDLRGSGNLVLTELGRGKSSVIFAAALEGDYIIFDRAREQVAAEIRKPAGQVRRIALAPGEYVLKKRLADHLEVQTFALDGDHAVDEALMTAVAFEDDDTKGGRDTSVGLGFEARAVYQTYLSAAARSELFPPVLMLGGAIELQRIAGASLDLELAVGSRSADLGLGDLTVGYDFFEASVAIEMIWAFEVGAGFSALAGPRLAGVYFRRTLPEIGAQDHFTLSPMGVAGARYAFGRFHADLVARLGFLSFSVDDNRSLFFFEGGLIFGVSIL